MNILQELSSDESDNYSNISLSRKCELLGVSRSHYYYVPTVSNDSEIANLIYEIWQKCQFYGYRKITACLHDLGHNINHKKVLRLMREMGIYALVPAPNTSKPSAEKLKLPYLLGDMKILYPNQVWQVDITYIKLPTGFVYLLALIDVYSRYVVAHQISNMMDASLATSTLKMALLHHKPEIINMDQGSQFTSYSWLDMLELYGIMPSMTSVGRCIDNVYIERFWRSLKVEEIYLNPPDNLPQLRKQVTDYINFYNHVRPHQAIGYKKPADLFEFYDKNGYG